MNWKKLVLEQSALIEQLRARIVELEAEAVALKNELAAANKIRPIRRSRRRRTSSSR